MKHSKVYQVSILVFLALFMLGCGAKPVEQIEQTEKARQEAKEEYADQFALEDWSEGEKAWAEAEAKLEAEKWGESTTLLLKAKGKYIRARDIAKGKKEEALREIEGTQKAASIRFETLKENVAKLRLSSARQKTFDELSKEIEMKIAEVSEHVEKGEFNEAKFLAGKTLRQVWEAEQEFKK